MRMMPSAKNFSLRDMRMHQAALFYPAMSVPLGPEDELSCPPAHVGFLRSKLQESDGLHLLIIGYRGYDEKVRELLAESDNRPARSRSSTPTKRTPAVSLHCCVTRPACRKGSS